MEKIILENVTKELDDIKVLNKINLELTDGKIYGIIGRNGSGKSMLLKTICGFLPPTEGRVFINGEDIYQKNIFPDSIAAMIDKPNYLPDLSAYENLKLIASINHTVNDDNIIDALNLVNLENNKKVFKKFSLGMKQKLGIAQVIMENTKIMIFDEPFNGVEEETTEKLRKYFKKKKKDGKIILISSHIKEDIETLCDKVYKIQDGTIINE